MAILSDFLAAVNQICAERGIEPTDVYGAIEDAVKTGYRKDYGEGEALVVDINEDKGEVKVFVDKKVVDDVTDKATQISLEDAQKIESKLKVGDHVQVDVTPEAEFGRIAVQTARQIILQKIREAEKEAGIKEFKDKIGTVETGVIQRMEGDGVLVEIRKATALMPAEERIPGEFYKSGSRLKFFIKEIKKDAKGKQLIVSRAADDFLKELFAIEVPEIRSESVEVKAVAREAGSRSKVAVISNQEGVDPIGACVGQKGIRIDNITDELKGEKIDIILWDKDLETYIANSLSPAQVEEIELDEEEKVAKVVVPDDQLSLAIGKDGQNVRLAAKLTGWKIDIQGETVEVEEKGEGDGDETRIGKGKGKEKGEKKDEKGKEKGKEKTLRQAQGKRKGIFAKLCTRTANALEAAGIDEEKLKEMSDKELLEIKGVGKKAVEEIERVVK